MSETSLRYLLLGVLGLVVTVSAQAPLMEFEVVSVKRAASLERGGGSSGLQPGGRFVMTNGPVRVLLGTAYQPPTGEIVEAPDWVTYEHYDVEARAGRNLRFEELAPLLRKLLADRFKLQAHMESRVRPAYELRVARADRVLGPAIRPSAIDCESRAGACSTEGGIGTGLIDSTGISMASFVTWLPALVGRPVLDKTNLSGYYALRVKYAVDNNDDNAPPVVTALREQLGLALEAVDFPTNVLVVDHIERPAEN